MESSTEYVPAQGSPVVAELIKLLRCSQGYFNQVSMTHGTPKTTGSTSSTGMEIQEWLCRNIGNDVDDDAEVDDCDGRSALSVTKLYV